MYLQHRLIFFLITISYALTAQSDEAAMMKVKSDSVTIFASRIIGPGKHLPIAFSLIQNVEQSNHNLSLQEYINNETGVFMQSSMNYAQDLRISLRGFGARSAFGIRGIKLIVDGIPETTPDGQGQVDNINLHGIQNIEILKGLSSGLYGNASGGVININTLKLVKKDFLEVNSSLGSFNTQNHNFRFGNKLGKSSLVVNGRYFKTNGYRNHSKSDIYSISSSFFKPVNNTSNVRFIINYTKSPKAEDPGGITIETYTEDRQKAREQNIQYNAGESIDHFKTAMFFNHSTQNRIIKSSVFYHRRNFEGRLPFSNGGWVNLARDFYGSSTSLQLNTIKNNYSNKFVIGTDLHFQNDARDRFINNDGIKSAQTLSQIEKFNNKALFTINQLTTNHLNFNLEARYDNNLIELEDNFKADEDQSSEINYNAFNFSLGISMIKWTSVIPFIRVATNFETPTLSELSSNPTGLGFNKDLKPTSSKSLEIGIRGRKYSNLSFSTNIFYIQSKNEILPFELEEFPGRDFFRNLGETERLGLETEANWRDKKQNHIGLSYSLSLFTFKDYIIETEDLRGNHLPGIPQHMLAIFLNKQLTKNLRININTKYTGSIYANNQNTVTVNSFWMSAIKCAYNLKLVKNTKLTLYVGINNLLNVEYFDNIRVNAFGNRFYEAGAERNYYVGLKFRIE